MLNPTNLPFKFTYKEFYQTYLQINSTQPEYLADITTCLNNHGNELFEIMHSLFKRYNIDLLAVCFEETGDAIALHPHFHFLLNLDIPPTEPIPNNYVYTKLSKVIKSELVAKLKAMKIANFNPSTFVKYKGSGYGITPIDNNLNHICSKECRAECLHKHECFNDTKPKSCANVVARLSHPTHIRNNYDYIRLSKTTNRLTNKQHFRFFEPTSPQYTLSSLYKPQNLSLVKSF